MKTQKKLNTFLRCLFLLLSICIFISFLGYGCCELDDNKPPSPSNINAAIAPDNYEIIVVWECINDPSITYNLYYDVSVDGKIIKSNTEKNISSPFHHNYDLVVGSTYCYKLVSVKGKGKSFFSDPVCLKFTPPEPPDNVQLVSGNKEITIYYKNISDINYDIYMDTSAIVSKNSYLDKKSNVTSPYTWTNLTNNIKYYFVLTAINGCGKSDESSLVNGIPREIIYKLSKFTLSGGSVRSDSNNFRQKGLIGQSTPIGFCQSASFKNKSGVISRISRPNEGE